MGTKIHETTAQTHSTAIIINRNKQQSNFILHDTGGMPIPNSGTGRRGVNIGVSIGFIEFDNVFDQPRFKLWFLVIPI